MNTTLEQLGYKMDRHGETLMTIEMTTKAVALAQLADQTAREKFYDKLAGAIINLARFFGAAVLIILALAITGIFKQDIQAQFGNKQLKIITEQTEGKP